MRPLVAALAACVLLLTGCATVPTKGQLRSGNREGLADDQGGVGVEAKPPREGSDPTAIMAGFLEAMSDSNQFDTAREYMTPEAAANWQPEKQTIVYEQSPDSLTPKPGGFQLSARQIATIDDRGEWAPSRAESKTNFFFGIAKVNGQNRITTAPPGVLLANNQASLKLLSFDLYFFARDRKTLVPDPVYLPRNPSNGQTATLLVQELLKGPTKRLGNGVVSMAPPGTAIQVSVPVDLGTATVTLNDAAGQLRDTERRALAAQIVYTLNQISLRVQITVNGAPLLPESPEVLPISLFTEFDPAPSTGQMANLYGLQGGKVQRIEGLDDGAENAARPLTTSPLYQHHAESFAVSLRADSGAIVTTIGGERVVAYAKLDSEENGKNEPIKQIETQGKVLRPSYDFSDNLWILDRADSASPRLRVRTKDGTVEQVDADFRGQRPQAIRMAPDGVRVLLVMKAVKSGQNSVQTASIQTDDESKKLKLAQLRNLEVPLTAITDAAWSKKGILVAGVAVGNNSSAPWLVNPDGSSLQLLPGATAEFPIKTIASNPNVDTLPVFGDTDNHIHWQSRDLTWTSPNDTTREITPTYPG
nr:LpqB family beta-propeller domain-containing protein [Kribbella sandramycini]